MEDLKHWGVLGMHWGHRKSVSLAEARKKVYAKDVGIDTGNGRVIAISKGQEAGHITGNPNLLLKNNPLYVSSSKRDMLTYRANYADQIRAMRNIDKVFSYKLEATKNLVSPDKKKRIDEFIALANEDKEFLSRMADSHYNVSMFGHLKLYFAGGNNKKKVSEYKRLVNSKNPLDNEKAFLEFSRYLGLNSDQNRKIYFDRLSKQGFNSLYDDNDISGDYKSKTSLIVFDSAKAFKIKSKEADTQKDTERYYDQWEKMEKKSKS